eukprot:s1968_g15.t1
MAPSLETSPQYVVTSWLPGKMQLLLDPRLPGDASAYAPKSFESLAIPRPLKVVISSIAPDVVTGNHPKYPWLPFHFSDELLKRAKKEEKEPVDVSPDHRPLPSVAELIGALAPAWYKDEGTTMMVKNIPNRYSTEQILEELHENGFSGSFDFLYLPMDFGTKRNKGYFFLNLRTHELAQIFTDVFSRHCFNRYKSNKVPEVALATVQGFEKNVWKYLQHSSDVNTPWFKQLLFRPHETIPGIWTCDSLSVDVLPEPLRSRAISEGLPKRRGNQRGNGTP